jgi:hypothetical protein
MNSDFLSRQRLEWRQNFEPLKKYCFRSKFKEFSDEHDMSEEFIDSPEWKQIMIKAKEVLQAFGQS